MGASVRAVKGAGYVLAVAIAFLAVLAGLFAFPLVAAALGMFLPFALLAALSYVVLRLNLTRSLWNGRRPFFFGVMDDGFLVCLAAFALYGCVSVATDSLALVWALIAIVCLGLCRFIVGQFGAWYPALGFCAAVLLLLQGYLRFMLPHPEWFFDFMSSLMIVAGLTMVVAGAIGSLRRSLQQEATASAGRTSILRYVVPTLAFVAIASGVVTYAGMTKVSAADRTGAIPVRIDAPNLAGLDLHAGEFTLLLRNPDPLAHTFTLRPMIAGRSGDAHGQLTGAQLSAPIVDIAIGPGSERLLTVQLSAGDYNVSSRVPGDITTGTSFRVR